MISSASELGLRRVAKFSCADRQNYVVFKIVTLLFNQFVIIGNFGWCMWRCLP